MDLVEKQAGCQLKPPPQWRLGTGEIDPDPAPDQIGPSRAPPGLRCGEVSRVGCVRRATGDLGGKPPDQIRWRLRDIAGMVAARHAARLPVPAPSYICTWPITRGSVSASPPAWPCAYASVLCARPTGWLASSLSAAARACMTDKVSYEYDKRDDSPARRGDVPRAR